MKINLIGYKTGKLTVIEYVGKNKRGKNIWKCKCECGKETIADTTTIKNNKIKSCGCSRIPDMIGVTYGRLTVIERVANNGIHVMYKCKCECGNEVVVAGKNLRRGYTVSCGCYSKENSSKRMSEQQTANFIDLTNQRFGKLSVIKNVGIDKDTKQRLWQCQCDCGSIITTTTNSLRTGNTQSCGCIISKGEYLIAKILSQNNISFVKQKTFDDCLLPSGYKAKFDFYVNNQYIIEFDGAQHFKSTGVHWNDEDKYQRTKESDILKNQYCFSHNIPIIRIPYWHYKNLCIEDLTIESSKFLI